VAEERPPRGDRLKGRDSFKRLMREGKSVEDALLVIRYLPLNENATSRRVGVTVSRNCGKAVIRNRLRRRLREIYRRRRDSLPPAGEFLLIAKSEAIDAPFPDLDRSYQKLSDELVKKSS